jgi:hypothetical protein
MVPQWSKLEEYRQLLQEFERKNGDYQRALERSREARANGGEADDAKTELANQYAEVTRLYNQISDLRRELAGTLDASLAAS